MKKLYFLTLLSLIVCTVKNTYTINDDDDNREKLNILCGSAVTTIVNLYCREHIANNPKITIVVGTMLSGVVCRTPTAAVTTFGELSATAAIINSLCPDGVDNSENPEYRATEQIKPKI